MMDIWTHSELGFCLDRSLLVQGLGTPMTEAFGRGLLFRYKPRLSAIWPDHTFIFRFGQSVNKLVGVDENWVVIEGSERISADFDRNVLVNWWSSLIIDQHTQQTSK